MFNSGFRGKREQDGRGVVNPQSQYVQTVYPQPAITGWSIAGSDDAALNPAGGQTVLVNGSGFATGASATLGGSQISVVTVVSPTQISFTAPANAGGSYTLIVYNSSGGAAILVPGLTYSSVPTWTTAAGSIGTYYETTAINSNVVATSDSALTYSLSSGSLPTGATLYANGVITGSAPADSGSTTYTFNITATDAESQDTTRTFTMTINTDVVTWVSPADGTTYTLNQNAAMSNVTLSASDAAGYSVSYSANALPTGVSVSGNVVTGTPTTVGSTSSLFTATAATTGRTATRTFNWVVQLPSDAYFQYVTTLLSPTAPTSTFLDDASTNNFNIANAGATPRYFSPYTSGYYSDYFGGTNSDYATIPYNSAFDFGTGDFTIECWVNCVGNSPTNGDGNRVAALITAEAIDAGASTSWALFILGSGGTTGTGITFNNRRSGSLTGYSWTGTVTQNTWHHVAVSRTSGNLSIYFDGTRVYNNASMTASVTAGGNPVRLGWFYPTNYNSPLTGYLSNARVVKGTGIYSGATISVPTGPLTAVSGTSLLTAQSNRYIDNSTNNFTVTPSGTTLIKASNPFVLNSSYATYGSTFYSNVYSTLPSSSNLTLTGDFTIEFWIYCNNTYSSQGILGGAATNVGIYTDSSGYFQVDASNSNFVYNSDSTRILDINAWTHVAVTRSGSTIYIFKNGVSRTVSTVGTPGSATYNFSAGTIGQYGSPAKNASGWIADMRIVKGTAVYTSNFTPPAAPLTAIADTQLLTLQNNQPVNNSTFLDSSNNTFGITRNGNTTQGTFAPFGANWSNFLDGTGDRLSVPGNAAFAFGTGDFTIEFWLYRTYAQDGNVVGYSAVGAPYWNLMIYSDRMYWQTAQGATNLFNVAISSYSNKWAHYSIVRSSGTTKLYINGTQQASASDSTNYSGSGSTLYVGWNSELGYLTGYLSNLRIVKGTAVYTSAFTPPTGPLTAIAGTSLLTCQSNRFVDNSGNNFAITINDLPKASRFSPFSNYTVTPTSYSNYFDGSGDSLTLASSSAMSLSGEFTIECWVYWAGTSLSYQNFVGSNDSFSSNASFFRVWGSAASGGLAGKIGIGNPTHDATSSVYSTNSLTANTWTHVAATRDSSNIIRVFINGNLERTGSTDASLYNFGQGGTCIGDSPWDGANGWYTGYISNLRIVKGQALYTSAFTPSTLPLTTTSQGATAANVSLLTCQSSTIIDNSTNSFTITANGDTKPLQFNPFGSTTSSSAASWSADTFGGSAYFDGTSDYLDYGSNTVFALGTNDFTVEAWVYITAATDFGIFGVGGAASGSYGFYWISSSQKFQSTRYGDAGGAGITTNTYSINQWYHVAAVRSGGTAKIYINGVADSGATYSLGNVTATAADSGRIWQSSGSNNGYISNLRVVPGTAVYTSNFVPPAAPVTAIKNTALLPAANPAIIDYSMQNDFETLGDAKIVTSTVKYGSNSMYFDGNGDYLYTPPSNNFTFGLGNFTIEFWVYPTVNARQDWIDINSGSTPRALIYYDGSNIAYYTSGGGNSITGAAMTLNTWQYITVCRSSGSTKLFINGTQSGSTYSDSNNYTSPYPVYIGKDGAGSTYVTGYISDLRITRGYARYTTNFTPPSEADKTN